LAFDYGITRSRKKLIMTESDDSTENSEKLIPTALIALVSVESAD
jgi:hypothetical protein